MSDFCCMPPVITDADMLTAYTYDDLYYRIENMALNVLRWDNLPDRVTQLLIERYLFYYGACAFFFDDILAEYVVLPVIAILTWDTNGVPTRYRVGGYDGYQRELDRYNSVLILNNYNAKGDSDKAALFASRLMEVKRTIDCHTTAHRVNKIIPATENKVKSFKALIQKIKGFELYTIASPSVLENLKSTTSIDVSTPYIIDKLDYHYNELWNECYDYFGVDNAPQKKERVLVDEISVQTSAAEIFRNVRLNPRQDACEKINEMFGLSVECHANMNSIRGNGGDRVGNLYDDAQNSDGSDNNEGEAG